MALTQDQRIEISKKISSIPAENAGALDSKDKLEEAKLKIKSQDDANKSFSDAKTVFIDKYQKEVGRLDGNERSEVVEQDFLDSALSKSGNFFFPNKIDTPLPSVPDGVWKNFTPFAKSKAIGKSYTETYGSIQKEGDIISTIQSYIANLAPYTEIQKTTGQKCTVGTPPALDVIANDPVFQTLASNIISQVNNWKSFLNSSLPFVVTDDPNATKQAENNASIADMNNAVSVIDLWLSKPNFDTAHGQTDCPGFNSYNPYLLQQTKFRTDGLTILTNEITDRLAYIVTRVSQLTAVLGDINQNLTTGNINSSTGLYGERFAFISLRLNLMSGTLRKLESLKLGQKSQDEIISFNAQALSAYSSVMFNSTLQAPSTGSDKLHLKDASGISPGDSVYIVANNQPEVSLMVVSKTGNLVQFDQVISQRYRTDNLSRVYKIL